MVDITRRTSLTVNFVKVVTAELSKDGVAVSIGNKVIRFVRKVSVNLNTLKSRNIFIAAVAVKNISSGIRTVDIGTCCPIDIVTVVVLIEQIIDILSRIVSDIAVNRIYGFIGRAVFTRSIRNKELRLGSECFEIGCVNIIQHS